MNRIVYQLQVGTFEGPQIVATCEKRGDAHLIADRMKDIWPDIRVHMTGKELVK